MPGWTVTGTPCRYAWARIEACFQRCSTAIAAGRPALLAHGPQQVGPGRGERMGRLGGDGGGQLVGVGQRGAVFVDEPAQRTAVAEAVERAGHQGQVDVGGRLVPGAERAAGDVHLDALGRGAEPGVFPVVDRAGAVGGQVRQPAAGHHPFEDAGRAVAEQVGAVDQHHRRPALAGGADLVGAVADSGGDCARTRLGGRRPGR